MAMKDSSGKIAYTVGTVASPLLFQAVEVYLIYLYTDLDLNVGRRFIIPGKEGKERVKG